MGLSNLILRQNLAKVSDQVAPYLHGPCSWPFFLQILPEQVEQFPATDYSNGISEFSPILDWIFGRVDSKQYE